MECQDISLRRITQQAVVGWLDVKYVELSLFFKASSWKYGEEKSAMCNLYALK